MEHGARTKAGLYNPAKKENGWMADIDGKKEKGG
jgi:hypothetical protein